MAKKFALIQNSGKYTPTLTNDANIDSSTADIAFWTRIGNIVTVAGRVVVDPTAAAATTLRISLPFPTYFSNSNQLSGIISSGAGPTAGVVVPDTTNDAASAVWPAPDGTSRTMRYIFTYEIQP